MTSLPAIDETPEAAGANGRGAAADPAGAHLDTPPAQPSGTERTAVSGQPGRLRRRGSSGEAGERTPRALPPSQPEFDIAPNDPIISYFQSVSGPVDISSLALESPALDQMRKAGIVLVVPLVSSGELIGLLNLGPRLSERGYSSDDKQLLDALAGYAAPAMRVGQLVRQQEAEARNRERIEQELKVAQLIQQQFLPKHVPDLPSWQLAAFYRPARTVGGDFYDFVDLPDGRVMVICGDVTDKGVPAALVMASTHSLLRATSQRLTDPGAILARVNDLLCEDIPANMFVTCLAMAIDPSTGHVEYANAGHNLPYVRSVDGVRELKATGMPLGLMTGMTYEQKSAVIARGECMLLHSDGLAEAHNERREMFGFDRLARLVAQAESGQQLIDRCLSELERFTGPGVEQEDDITLVALERAPASGFGSDEGVGEMPVDVNAPPEAWRVLDEFSLASEPGNERAALQRVAEAVAPLGLSGTTLERLKTAVAETTMNAIEHGNGNRPELPVEVQVTTDGANVAVSVTDLGGHDAAAVPPTETPDLDAKLAGTQTPRGWGLFLIRHMVDEMDVATDGARHTVRLVVDFGSDRDRGGGFDDEQV